MIDAPRRRRNLRGRGPPAAVAVAAAAALSLPLLLSSTALLSDRYFASASSSSSDHRDTTTCSARDGSCEDSEAPSVAQVDVPNDADEFFDQFLPPEKRKNKRSAGAEGGEGGRRAAAASDPSSSTCADEHEMCATWSEAGECAKNPGYMLISCKKSCDVCSSDDEADADASSSSSSSYGVAQVAKGDRASETLEIIRRTESYVRDIILVDPSYESVRDDCINRHELCAFWAVIGECEKNPNYMTLQCAPACMTCDKIDFANRCPVDPDEEDALGPGDLNKLFERLVTDEAYKKYEPTVHSRPSRPLDAIGDGENDSDYRIGPWVITLEHFLSPEECQTLIDLGAKEGYERSTDVGEKQFDGTYGKLESKRRTSENAWCQDTCYEDPTAKAVIHRIEESTGIPERNSEYLQLLRYETGQFYKEHHDYIPHQTERPPGVRLITLFLYLNDVEEGGGTNFPLLDNLTIMPKTGRALIWPSVLDEDPNAKDGRTEHQALPVEKGMKYGANAWLHMRDFKGPNAKNCH